MHLPSTEEEREVRILRIEDAMHPPRGGALRAEETVREALERAEPTADFPGDTLLVSWESGRWSCVKRAELQAAIQKGRGDEPLRVAAPGVRLPRLHPDQSLDLALRLMRDSEFLPVVHRADPRRLLGVISLQDILTAYRRTPAAD